jgi:hypothetical protein
MRYRGLAHTVSIVWLAGHGNGSASSALTISTSANAADGWRAIAPVGNLAGQPITAVGLAWEGTHVGWNTSITFDDSDVAGWHTPVPRDVSRYGSIAINHIWADDPQGSGDTPAYVRKVFTLDFEPTSASFGGDLGGLLDSVIDDDVQIYINGVLVLDDRDGVSGAIPFTNVTAHLLLGENLIAVKAHDSFGADEHFSLRLEIVPVPEPSSVLLVALGLAALSGRPVRRRTTDTIEMA